MGRLKYVERSDSWKSYLPVATLKQMWDQSNIRDRTVSYKPSFYGSYSELCAAAAFSRRPSSGACPRCISCSPCMQNGDTLRRYLGVERRCGEAGVELLRQRNPQYMMRKPHGVRIGSLEIRREMICVTQGSRRGCACVLYVRYQSFWQELSSSKV